MLIAQITDIHLVRPGALAMGRVDTAAMLQACVESVAALDPQPDLVVLTGDLVDAGAPEEYALLRRLLAPLKPPLLAIPGNHDEREALRAAFADCAWMPRSGFIHHVHDAGPLRIVALDTLRPGHVEGELCAERLAWLSRTLAERPGRPTLVLMHHPPFATGLRAMDEGGLVGREAFAAIVARHPQVELIVAGHVHRTIHAAVGGRRALVAPSCAHQIALDLRPEAPAAWCLEPPGFMLHRWTGEGFASHAAVCGRWPGPFAY